MIREENGMERRFLIRNSIESLTYRQLSLPLPSLNNFEKGDLTRIARKKARYFTIHG